MSDIIIVIFILGYLAIIFENKIRVNKAATALFMGALSWGIIATQAFLVQNILNDLQIHLIAISELVFFLLGAMTIVEIIDAHDGFQVIAEKIKTQQPILLIWKIAIITFFLSAILDNLTTAIVMVSIINKVSEDKKVKWYLFGLVIIAANAGGAWSPIGDVTTTMLWMGGQITSLNIMHQTFLASFICMAIPTCIISYKLRDSKITISSNQLHHSSNNHILENNIIKNISSSKASSNERNVILFLGLGCFIAIPVFHFFTHLPPYLGMLFCLSIMWITTELLHHQKTESEKDHLSAQQALQKIDVPSMLFFIGILLSVAALQVTGILSQIALGLDHYVHNVYVLTGSIGLLSAVLDNIPLVAGVQNMYPLVQLPTNHIFWELLSYCAGTGGSCLIIGSAAGVMVMGLEKISFGWYLKNISWMALIGFLSGILVFMVQQLF
jgi:Na+/H+ antiporter NhaD/arsenite permease-like protein